MDKYPGLRAGPDLAGPALNLICDCKLNKEKRISNFLIFCLARSFTQDKIKKSKKPLGRRTVEPFVARQLFEKETILNNMTAKYYLMQWE